MSAINLNQNLKIYKNNNQRRLNMFENQIKSLIICHPKDRKYLIDNSREFSKNEYKYINLAICCKHPEILKPYLRQTEKEKRPLHIVIRNLSDFIISGSFYQWLQKSAQKGEIALITKNKELWLSECKDFYAYGYLRKHVKKSM
ncbi:MAG: hypothetical protein IJ660_01860 [Alphaproteobacteria bacterium]|nr:hypothetical protein [Alphaproteobacteria bacterium]